MLSINSVSGYGNYQNSSLKPKQLAFGAEIDMRKVNQIARKLGNGGNAFLKNFGDYKKEINPLKAIERHGSKIISKEVKIPIEECCEGFDIQAMSESGKTSIHYLLPVKPTNPKGGVTAANMFFSIIMQSVGSIK